MSEDNRLELQYIRAAINRVADELSRLGDLIEDKKQPTQTALGQLPHQLSIYFGEKGEK